MKTSRLIASLFQGHTKALRRSAPPWRVASPKHRPELAHLFLRSEAGLSLSPVAHGRFQSYCVALAPHLKTHLFAGGLNADHVDEMILVANGGAI